MEAKLNKVIANDLIYRKLLGECLSLEPEYCRIRDSLSPEEGEILERYLTLCEEMDHRRLTIALTMLLSQ